MAAHRVTQGGELRSELEARWIVWHLVRACQAKIERTSSTRRTELRPPTSMRLRAVICTSLAFHWQSCLCSLSLWRRCLCCVPLCLAMACGRPVRDMLVVVAFYVVPLYKSVTNFPKRVDQADGGAKGSFVTVAGDDERSVRSCHYASSRRRRGKIGTISTRGETSRLSRAGRHGVHARLSRRHACYWKLICFLHD